jgi:hypothetical protein
MLSMSLFFDTKSILGSMLMAGAITAITMTAMSAKNKYQSDPKINHEKLVKSKNTPKMDAMDRHAVLADMKADDAPLTNTESTTTDNKDNTSNTPKMSAMDRYAVLSEMRAKDGNPLPEPKIKPTTTTAIADVLASREPYGILSQMKATENEKNTEPEPKYHRTPQMASSDGGNSDGYRGYARR